MRRFCALITALCLILCTLTVFADTSPGTAATPLPDYTLRAAPDEIKVFAATSMKANIVGYIIPGSSQEVSVLSVSGEWCYISFTSVYGTSYGYIPLSCFDVAAAPTPTPVPDVSYAAGTQAWVINAAEGYRLNLREAASATAKSLGKYYTGTPVMLTGEQTNGFARVLLAGTIVGWLDARFLTVDALGFVPEMPMVTISNKGGGATLRSGPGSTFSRIDWYPHGTMVTVLGVRADGWYHVTVGEQVGFISEGLLSGTFPFGYGMDSDNPNLSSAGSTELSCYINTRSAGGQLHLRKTASSSAKSLGLFYTGTPLTVVSYTRTGWAYVRIGHTEGYMDADYLTPTRPAQYGEVRIIRNRRANGLNLRSLPSTGGEILEFAENFSSVIVLGELSDGWCYVEYGGQLGYMLGDGSLASPN